MDITKLSSEYHVRKLSEDDIESILNVFAGNPMYFRYCPPVGTRESIIDDMKALPPGKAYEDKYYIGFFDGNMLIAVMDLILSYPNNDTALIGFFMVAAERQGNGLGSFLIADIISCLKECGYAYTRLGYVKGNGQSRAFWLKNEFTETGIEAQTENYTIVIMQRNNK